MSGPATTGDRAALDLGRDVCVDLAAAEQREWLTTNGIGGYASGTVAGLPTRGYHGLLVAALAPPVGRTVKLVTVLESVTVSGEIVELGTLRWHDGTVAPTGYRYLEHFRLDGSVPVWRFATGRFVLEKRISMDHGANVTRISYANLWSREPVTLSLRVIIDHRDYHGRTFAWDGAPAPVAHGDTLSISAGGASDLHVRLEDGRAEVAGTWYRGFDLAQERARGLTDSEDHMCAGTLSATLAPGGSVQFVANTGPQPASVNCRALAACRTREETLLGAWQAARGADVSAAPRASAPDWVRQLVLAADQFIVARRLAGGRAGHTVIAGYHWFSDWGRDTMISLPGLTLETGRPEIARSVLTSFAAAVDRGMIPNRFPDAGTAPEFNTVDATFWFIEAVRAYHAATGDTAFVETLFPVLADIVEWHRRGTRYAIRLDPADGLICAGEPGVQLTWMDAKVGDWVVTPRIGKPIEVNALWCSALAFMSQAARLLGRPAGDYEDLLARAERGFQRFWNSARGYCFDVLDGPNGHEAALRPNQIFAASLPHPLLSPEQRRAVVAVCEDRLLTPAGLRSLSPDEPGYTPHYCGDSTTRDGAYHQGTVWSWLIGPFIEAHLKTFGDVARAEQILRPLADQIRIEGLGSISEIFEAEAPFAPRGCIAQAWSVAEVLRAWHMIDRYRRTAASSAPVAA
jgi:predicted glycogen debranching enzyme